ncbi:MAG: hypothetical protein Q8916_05800 [Bacteroidota bacterium]|nr:hypothetical protein [Bacteroidota bacterium]MDP4229902.1 hypothetical protein [Bacteroidota bacterium]
MKSINKLGLGLAISLALGLSKPALAQNFSENEDLWKTETIRARSIDTVRLERHSFLALPAVSDTSSLIYHEPLPDSVMPKSAIEIGRITIQASSAEDVLAMLEKQARSLGADWIVGFNEPRMKINKDREVYYRSEAMLYKVINPELVPESQIASISCTDSHLQNYTAVESFVQHLVAKSGE